MIARGIKLPQEKILLFWDRHASHMTLEVCQTAQNLGIILIGLYPNSTFLYQPCDVGVFKPIKDHWREEVRAEKFKDVNKVVTKAEFPILFMRSMNTLSNGTVKNAFETTGIFPWNPDAIDFSKCIGKRKSSITVPTETTVSMPASFSLSQLSKIQQQ